MLKSVAVALIRWYQNYISVLTPPVCRFEPTCSNYTLQAVQHYGAIRGSWMGFWRIMRCHPFHPGGYDPVPLPDGAHAGHIHGPDCDHDHEAA